MTIRKQIQLQLKELKKVAKLLDEPESAIKKHEISQLEFMLKKMKNDKVDKIHKGTVPELLMVNAHLKSA